MILEGLLAHQPRRGIYLRETLDVDFTAKDGCILVRSVLETASPTSVDVWKLRLELDAETFLECEHASVILFAYG